MKTRTRRAERSLSPAIITLLIIGCTIGFVSLLYVLRESLTPRAPAQAELKSDDPKIEAQVANVAAKFFCACGQCGSESLEHCTCETARKARQMIRTSLEAGQPIADIVSTVNRSFGGLQDESAGILENHVGTAMTTSQRREVLSHFRCPCGRCGMENLADCECDHPRGAKEVKGFLDLKLSNGEYTSQQLVAEVEKVYGGRKF